MDLSWVLVLYDLIIFPFGVPRRILEFVLLFVSRLMNSQNMLGNEVYDEEDDEEEDDDWMNQFNKEDGLNENIFNFEENENNNENNDENDDDDISLDDIINASQCNTNTNTTS